MTDFKAELKEIVDTVVFVIVALIVIRFFIFEPRVIPSASMHPTLIERDRLIIERYSRFFVDPKRGDMIVFYPPEEILKPDEVLKYDFWSVFKRLTGLFCKDIAFIKRVIGAPGDSVEVKKEADETYGVYVNGEKINEPYIQSEYEYPDCKEDMHCKVKLGADEYFVMGDNRGNSYDSRFWGTVKKDKIIGVTKLRFWPLNRLKYFAPVKY